MGGTQRSMRPDVCLQEVFEKSNTFGKKCLTFIIDGLSGKFFKSMYFLWTSYFILQITYLGLSILHYRINTIYSILVLCTIRQTTGNKNLTTKAHKGTRRTE
jgi:hypothetical protein